MKYYFLFFTLFFLSIIAQAQVVINEYSVSNLSDFQDNNQKYEDWIELYNTSSSAINLTGYFLSDNPNTPHKWALPSGVIIQGNGYLVIWASGRNVKVGSHIHTNFKLSQTKNPAETIVFSDANGVIESRQLQLTQNHHSRGRKVDGGDEWGIFTTPTLSTTNTGSTAFNQYAATPTFNQAAGFYSTTQSISISSANTSGVIRYTTDGSSPTPTSALYTAAIPVTQTTIIKATYFPSDPLALPSLTEFNTYFINEEHSLRVISIASEELEFLLNGDKSYFPIGSFELFDRNKTRVSHGYGDFNSHGQDSWVHDQRSIDYIARDEMGYHSKVTHKLYKNSDREEFQRIILRAAGDDNYPGYDTSAHIRDVFVETLADQGNLHLDVRKGARCVMYVNGKYWGVYSTREKVDDPDYTKYYHGQTKYDLDFIMVWGETWVEYGDYSTMSDWNNLFSFIMDNDMSIPANYHIVTEQYDVKSLVDYVLVNSFVVCTDWLNWNVGWWRGNNPDGGHKKWGYILWDEDATFNHYENYTGVPSTTPDTDPCYAESLNNEYSDPEGHISILNKLRTNPEFDQYYISRYIDLANSTFSCENMLSLLDSMTADIAPEMPRHIQRFGGNMAQWESNITKLRNFIIARCNAIPEGINDCYELSGPYDVMLNVIPANAGNITINSLNISQLPWTGSYHEGVDILLKGTPNTTGYIFDYWELNNHIVTPSANQQSVVLNLTGTDTIVAHFKEPVLENLLVINEINYHSSADFDSKDWVEFYNPQDYSLDISNWVFKDEDDAHEFVFPQGTAINAHDYLVLARDLTTFGAQYPSVNNTVGNMDFGLSNGGELLRIFNAQGALVDTVLYDDKDPWPTEPDGSGPTLELLNPAFDNALVTSWKAWPDHGTPGAINHGYVGVSSLSENELSFSIQPNPFSDHTVISITKAQEIIQGQLTISDVLGRTISTQKVFDASHITIHQNKMVNGIYLFRFIDSRNRIVTGRLVIQE